MSKNKVTKPKGKKVQTKSVSGGKPKDNPPDPKGT
jgi:hypothetical protein